MSVCNSLITNYPLFTYSHSISIFELYSSYLLAMINLDLLGMSSLACLMILGVVTGSLRVSDPGFGDFLSISATLDDIDSTTVDRNVSREGRTTNQGIATPGLPEVSVVLCRRRPGGPDISCSALPLRNLTMSKMPKLQQERVGWFGEVFRCVIHLLTYDVASDTSLQLTLDVYEELRHRF